MVKPEPRLIQLESSGRYSDFMAHIKAGYPFFEVFSEDMLPGEIAHLSIDNFAYPGSSICGLKLADCPTNDNRENLLRSLGRLLDAAASVKKIAPLLDERLESPFYMFDRLFKSNLKRRCSNWRSQLGPTYFNVDPNLIPSFYSLGRDPTNNNGLYREAILQVVRSRNLLLRGAAIQSPLLDGDYVPKLNASAENLVVKIERFEGEVMHAILHNEY